jgi:hypothetical protein
MPENKVWSNTVPPRLLADASIVRYDPPILASDILMKKPPMQQNIIV